MSVIPLTYPAILILATLTVMLGDALALWHQSAFFLAAPALVLVSLRLWPMPVLLGLVGRASAADDQALNWFPCWQSRTGCVVCLVLCVLPFLSYTYCLYRTGQQTCNLADYAGKAVVVRGSIIDGAETGDGAYVFGLAAVEMLFPKRQALSTKIKVIQFPDAHARAGEAVRLKPGLSGSFELRVRAPMGGRSAGKSACFAYCAQVWCQPTNINGCALAAQIRAGGWLDDLCTRVRDALVRMHENNIGKDLGDLLSSMVLGDKAVKLSDAVVTAFRNVGLSHVLAASGFNLTVVTAMTYFICRWLIRSQPLVNVICLINTICYVCLAGASASVMRAALMCAILLAVRSTNVRVHLMAALALSLFVSILFDPGCIADVGLQLSYAATGALIFAGKSLCRLLCQQSNGFPKWIAETISAVLLSQSAVMPIQLLCFSQVGMLFVPANLAITPVLAPVTIIGFLSSAISTACAPVPILSGAVAKLCYLIDLLAILPLQMMMAVVRYLASFDAAILRLGPPTSAAVFAYVSAWFAMASCLNLRRLRALAFVFFAVATFFLLWRPALEEPILVCFPKGVLCVSESREATFAVAEPVGADASSTGSRTENERAIERPNPLVQKWCIFHGLKLTAGTSLLGGTRELDWIDANGLRFFFVTDAELVSGERTGENWRLNPGSTIERVLVLMLYQKHRNRAAEDAIRSLIERLRPAYVVFAGNRNRIQSAVRSFASSGGTSIQSRVSIQSELSADFKAQPGFSTQTSSASIDCVTLFIGKAKPSGLQRE